MVGASAISYDFRNERFFRKYEQNFMDFARYTWALDISMASYGALDHLPNLEPFEAVLTTFRTPYDY